MPVQPFQSRLVRQDSDNFLPVRVGPFYVSIQAGRDKASIPPRGGLLATEYTHFEVRVPSVSDGWTWKHWSHESGPVRRRVFPAVRAEDVQNLLDWLMTQDAEVEGRRLESEYKRWGKSRDDY